MIVEVQEILSLTHNKKKKKTLSRRNLKSTHDQQVETESFNNGKKIKKNNTHMINKQNCIILLSANS